MDAATAIRVQPAFPDVEAVRDVIHRAGPYWPLQRYAASAKELAALGRGETATFVPPWFRRDVALGGAGLVDGAEVLLDNDRFVEAASRVFGGASVVRPTTVYVNVMGPAPFPFEPHTDVPAFRGVTRDDHPVWLLHVMHRSGLFDPWRVRIATAVSWLYDGPGGDFHYWPDGVDAPGRVERAPFDNVAVVADNERTFHGVAAVGTGDEPLPTQLTLDSELFRVDGGWEARTPAAEPLHLDDATARITISWKANVFADEHDAARADTHVDDLDLDTVVEALLDDLRRSGHDVAPPEDPHRDDAWIQALADAHPRHAPRIAR